MDHSFSEATTLIRERFLIARVAALSANQKTSQGGEPTQKTPALYAGTSSAAAFQSEASLSGAAWPGERE